MATCPLIYMPAQMQALKTCKCIQRKAQSTYRTVALHQRPMGLHSIRQAIKTLGTSVQMSAGYACLLSQDDNLQIEVEIHKPLWLLLAHQPLRRYWIHLASEAVTCQLSD